MKYLKKIKDFDLSLFSTYRKELMGISAIAIILCHASGRGVILPVVLVNIFSYGNLGVDIFLLLSGIGMYFSFNQGKIPLKLWYKRRYCRILIPYVIISTPVWIIYCTLNGKNILDFFYYISTAAYWREHYGAWYIALLIPLYAVTPVMARIIDTSKYRWITTLLFTVVTIGLSRINWEWTSEDALDVFNNIQFVLCRVPLYIIGYGIGPSVKEKKRIPWLAILSLIAVQIIMGRIPIINAVYRGGLLAFVLTSILCLALKICTFAPILKILRWFGDISLESYLSNIYIAYLLSLFSWRFGIIDLSKGNYAYYGCVIIMGTFVAWLLRNIYNFFKNKVLTL